MYMIRISPLVHQSISQWNVGEEARRVRDMMSRNGGYIFSPAQDIQRDVPVENIMALLDVVRERIS